MRKFTLENSGLRDIIFTENSWKAPEAVAEVICTSFAHELVNQANAAGDLLAACEAFLAMSYPAVGQRVCQQAASDIQRHREFVAAAISKAKGGV